MARPQILRTLGNHVQSLDEPHITMEWVSAGTEELASEETIPVDADTLAGHPVSYFASATSVAQTLSSYISTVLGTSY